MTPLVTNTQHPVRLQLKFCLFSGHFELTPHCKRSQTGQDVHNTCRRMLKTKTIKTADVLFLLWGGWNFKSSCRSGSLQCLNRIPTWRDETLVFVVGLQLQRSKLLNAAPDVEAGTGTAPPPSKWPSLISPIFIQALTLTFLAEWGDRSQLTTIILAAREVC